MNPIKQLRLNFGLTHRDFADRAGIAVGAVVDNECGLYSQPSPSILNAFLGNDVNAKLQLKSDYRDWVRNQRKENYKYLPRLDEPMTSFEEYCIAVGGSVRGFCRVFCIQNSIVTSYIKTGSRWRAIKEALEEAGMPESMVMLLSRAPLGAVHG